MRLPDRFRTLRAHAILWIGLPMGLMLLGLFVAGGLAFPRLLASVLIDRHRQLASLSAVSVSEVVTGYARVLETLASNDTLQNLSPQTRANVLLEASDGLQVFTAGVFVLDQEGILLTGVPTGKAPAVSEQDRQEVFNSVKDIRAPVYRHVLADIQQQQLLVVAVPLVEEDGVFRGALVGAVEIQTSVLSGLVEKLTVGEDGFAYLVDSQGRVIFHPMRKEIGADYSDRPFVQSVIAGGSDGILWDAPDGESLIEASAPVAATGWGLIVQESWDSVTGPAQTYTMVFGFIGLVAVFLVVFVAWQVMRRIVIPVQLLADQTSRLARGENIEPFDQTGIFEVDALERSFFDMATQIATYRAGLRRYVGAITQSQEDERRRIARELHDETVQNLLAIGRRLELYQSSERDPQRQERLTELQSVVTDTLKGVRQISRDLRPLMLEDLGLVPALQDLLRAARHGEGALPHTSFDVSGEPIHLHPDQELALYRISQEALTNIRKHAQATGARLELTFETDRVCLEISDDGLGFHVPASLAELTQRGSFGLMGIQERVWAMGGTLEIHSAPGEGTSVCAVMPISPPESEIP